MRQYKKQKPKNEFVQFLELLAKGYKWYKDNEQWIDPILYSIKRYNQQQAYNKFINDSYIWQFPLPFEAYQRNPSLYLQYPAQLVPKSSLGLI